MPEKKKGFDLAENLKGVSSLNTSDAGREQIQYIHVEHILPDERNFYDLSGIDELADSIELVGLQQPLRVRPDPDHEGAYIIVSGHRRHTALKKLIGESQELYDRFCNAPCIVERHTGAADEVEWLLQELRLIYGNSDTRKLSSADLSKQAERVELLLYQLKEAGMEFPGKMRDHVAEACKVSASKLARLKVIRENLLPDLKKDWETGDLNESVAYVFAQQPQEVQRVMIQLITQCGAHNLARKWWHEGNVKYYAEKAARELKPRKGPRGSCESCDASGLRLRRMEHGKLDDHCNEGKCCHCCPNIGSCEYACPHLSREVEKAREKAKAKRAQVKEEKARENEDILAPKIRLWKRFGEARAAAGLTFEQYAKKAHVVAFRREKKVEDFEQGRKLTPSSGGLPYTGGDGLDEWRIKPLVNAADALGCSVDYLLCRTDEPKMAASASVDPPESPAAPPTDSGRWVLLEWISPERQPEDGQMAALEFDFGSTGKSYRLGRWADGGWCFTGGTPMGAQPSGWFPLPDIGEGDK